MVIACIQNLSSNADTEAEEFEEVLKHEDNGLPLPGEMDLKDPIPTHSCGSAYDPYP